MSSITDKLAARRRKNIKPMQIDGTDYRIGLIGADVVEAAERMQEDKSPDAPSSARRMAFVIAHGLVDDSGKPEDTSEETIAALAAADVEHLLALFSAVTQHNKIDSKAIADAPKG